MILQRKESTQPQHKQLALVKKLNQPFLVILNTNKTEFTSKTNRLTKPFFVVTSRFLPILLKNSNNLVLTILSYFTRRIHEKCENCAFFFISRVI